MKLVLFILCSFHLLLAQEYTEEVFIPFEAPPEQSQKKDEGGIDFFKMVPTAPKELEVTNEGSAEYDLDTEELIYKKNVFIKGDTGVQIYADEAVINVEEQKVTATGKVSVYNGPYLFRGERVVYHYVEKRLDTSTLRTGTDPFLLEARTLRNVKKDGKEVLIAEDASITTDDYLNPSYWIKADKFSLYPDKVAVMKGLTVEVGGITVFWLPYLAQSLDRDLGYHFTPGGQTNLGFYWKNRYGMHVGGERDPDTGRVKNPDYLLSLHVDPYTRRGVGVGVELEDLDYRAYGELGYYSAYGIYDSDPGIERTRVSREGLVEKKRFKLEVKDRREISEVWDGSLRLDSNLTYLSDQFFLEDFFQEDYQRVPQPDNVFSLSHVTDRFLTNLTTRFQLNAFHKTDTRLPELSFDFLRSPVGTSSLFYESQTSLGFLRERMAEEEKKDLANEALVASPTRFAEIQEILAERGFFRAHTWHEFSYPMLTDSGLSVTPRAGAGYTYYQTEGGSVSDGRMLGHLGLDVALKLSKVYHNKKNERLGLNGLNHIVQPYLSLSLLEASSVEGITPVDRFTSITRPRPINVGRYSALDVLEDWSILRTGVRQTFMTKRNGRAYEWLYLDSYLDFFLGDKDSPQSTSNLYNEISWVPLPWMRIYAETQFPVVNSSNDFSELYLGANFMMGRSTECRLGYGWLKNHPIVQDSNTLNYNVYHRVNDGWGLGLQHRWQFDDNTLELQKYSLHRNLKSWILTTEVYRRDFRVRQEWGFSLGFTLRDLPQISLPVSLER